MIQRIGLEQHVVPLNTRAKQVEIILIFHLRWFEKLLQVIQLYFLEQIISELKQGRNVSDIARLLNVSRSSLKDYVESRALKELVRGMTLTRNNEDAEAMIIGTIKCPAVHSMIQESV